MNEQTKSGDAVRQQVYGWCCCGPIGRLGALFWGVALMVIGFVWLLGNFDIIPSDWWRVLFPLLLIGLGAVYLFSMQRYDSRQTR